MADAHTLLWQHLEQAPQGLSFVRDHEAEGFTLPFYCAEAHLAIEVNDDPFKHREDGARERTRRREESRRRLRGPTRGTHLAAPATLANPREPTPRPAARTGLGAPLSNSGNGIRHHGG